MTEIDLRENVRTLAEARARQRDAANLLFLLQQQIDNWLTGLKCYQDMLQAKAKVNWAEADVKEAEGYLRQNVKALLAKQQPIPSDCGVKIKQYNVPRYDKDEARNWALLHAETAAAYLALDEKQYAKDLHVLSKTLDAPGSIETESRVFIDADLSRFLQEG
jgi:hypothetical protein